MPSPRSPQHAAFGDALRERRADLGLSQEALALESGLHRNYVGGVERGELNPSLTNIHRLARALELTAAQLLAIAERHEQGR